MKSFQSIFPEVSQPFRLVNFCHLRGGYGEINQKIQENYQYTYTDFGENRKELWADTYLNQLSEVYHLGIDIQVPEGTEFVFPGEGSIINVIHDKSKLGWGTRVDILDDRGFYWIFGHLSDWSLTGKKRTGGCVGMIVSFENNGQCFEHLHVQVCDSEKIFNRKINISGIDGYGSKKELKNWLNPLDLL